MSCRTMFSALRTMFSALDWCYQCGLLVGLGLLVGCGSQSPPPPGTSGTAATKPVASTGDTKSPDTKSPDKTPDKTPDTAKPAGDPAASNTTPSKTTPSKTSAAVTLKTVSRGEYDARIKSYQGKVVLVDFWASWCAPCKKAFPNTVALSRKYADKGLAVVTVAIDDKDAIEDALKFLQSQNATFENLRADQDDPLEAFKLFEVKSNSIPHLKLYDRDGKMVRSFGTAKDVPDEAEVERAIEELLKN